MTEDCIECDYKEAALDDLYDRLEKQESDIPKAIARWVETMCHPEGAGIAAEIRRGSWKG